MLALRLVQSVTSLCCRCSTAGAFVAGNRAGYAYPTWPLMEDQFVPDAERLFELQPLWRNFFENITTVQFDHRVSAVMQHCCNTVAPRSAVW